MHITLDSYSLVVAERHLCELALTNTSGHIVDAAELLGITRHALKRRIIKHNLHKLLLLRKEATPPPTGPTS